MNKPLIIGICGRAGAGKDTFAASFIEALAADGTTASRYGFADPLKEMCETLFGGDGTDHWRTQEGKASAFPFWGDVLGTKFSSGRNILVTMGTDVFRYHVASDIWLLIAGWRAKHNSSDVIVIADVRFDNEAAWIRAQGGLVVEVVNTNLPYLKRAGRFVRRLRTIPWLGTSKWLSDLLVRLGYASHASEDGISITYVTSTFRSATAADTSNAAKTFSLLYNIG